MRVSVDQAIELLNDGQPVALPTETVYGLAAALKDEDAIDDIFRLKGRPRNNPLIVHVSNIEMLGGLADHIPDEAKVLIKKFWPGPLTLVLPANQKAVPDSVRAGLPTAAFRQPQHKGTLEIIKAVGPLVMPSANLSGRPSATAPEHVEEDFGTDFPIVDVDWATAGIESTVITWHHGRAVTLRHGAITAEELEEVLGYPLQHLGKPEEGATPMSPGCLFRHYAPKAKLHLKGNPKDYPAVIGFSDRLYPMTCRFFSLGNSQHPEEAAEGLYDTLRQLDQAHITEAWVDMDFPRHGLWLAIADRLHRASEA